VRSDTGPRIFAGFLKFLACLLWLGSLVSLVILGSTVLSISPSLDLMSALAMVSSSGIIAPVLAGLIGGFLLFGLGEVIVLLSDIRKNTR
jgi:hypothetical protein